MRILAIDFDQLIDERLIKGLSREGFLVDRVISLQKGRWMAKTTSYDIIILISSFDILIENTNYLLEESPSAFFIALMPQATLEERISLFERGLDDVIIYPCSFRELVIKIRNLLRREKNFSCKFSCLNIDDLFIDTEKFIVKRGMQEIFLRRKEFDLLYFLFRNQGRVLTKVNILEGVWDSNADILTNTLEVHILNLRKKIDKCVGSDHRLIHTVYGRGYLFGLRPSLSGVMPATAPFSVT